MSSSGITMQCLTRKVFPANKYTDWHRSPKRSQGSGPLFTYDYAILTLEKAAESAEPAVISRTPGMTLAICEGPRTSQNF